MDVEDIYRTYFHDVFLYTRTLTQSEHIAEEITQETFFKALKSIGQFDGKKDIRAWLFTIAKHTYFTHYKQQQRHVHDEMDQMEDSVLDVHMVEQLMNEEEAFLIHRYLHDMEEPYKEVFSLRTFGELSFAKIGQLFGKSDGWARVTFYRAKKKIAAYMEERTDGKS
ncbi:RNA polymerase sigma factor [Paenibacillus lemnae]|uniref:RNA polymerase sigma factor n=1 Tax=Paenibacillus lemnae TaxID=1330551 RepID=A0A848M2F5_PAELE|nr:RNA polymerase sigma factor [Paenibacillus lemnae]NMO94420.1 RNA polymerase sigma factor [Paenibacillus lemnae]